LLKCALYVEARATRGITGLGDDDSERPVMREIEEPGDVPPRVVGDNAASEHGIQEGDAAVLLRARTSSAVACRYALLTASRNWSIRYQKVVATFRLGLLLMLAGHRDTSRRTSHSAAKPIGKARCTHGLISGVCG
jgi:hypothetical protein